MGRYPKELHVTNTDARLWDQGLVEIHVIAIVPLNEAQGLLNQIGAVL